MSDKCIFYEEFKDMGSTSLYCELEQSGLKARHIKDGECYKCEHKITVKEVREMMRK